MEWLERTELLLGNSSLDILKQSHVFIAGVGGVGAYAAEQIVRAGVGEVTIVDADVVNPSNRNRQIPALVSTTGMLKVDVMKQRFLDINPDVKVNTIAEYIRDERIDELMEKPYDYVIDAIDTLSPKVYLILSALRNKQRLVSSMGAGGKFDATSIECVDISKSYNCNLARMIRKRLTKFQVKKGFDVVFSPELVDKSKMIITDDELHKKSIVGTISYMPAVFGCVAASKVIRGLLEEGARNKE